MADRRHGAVLTALAALGSLAAHPARAQEAELVVTLAPDAARAGPGAWTWVRESVLPARIDGGTDAAFAALEIRIDERGRIVCSNERPPSPNGYATFELRVDGAVLARGACAADGTEQWEVPAASRGARLPAALQTLVARFAYEARTGWLALDVATATGNLMAAATDGDLVGEALTLGAAECGTVSIVARETADGTLQIRGRSGGGIALPALLIALADAQADRPASSTSLAEDLERWLLLAASARSEEQEEAARQLSRFDDPRARRALERLLFAPGRVRLVAMHGLSRLGAVESMGAIAAAADPEIPGSAAVAARAIARLAPPPIRDALAAQLAPDDSIPAPSPLAEPARTANAPRTPSFTWLWALASGITIGALGAAAGLRRAG